MIPKPKGSVGQKGYSLIKHMRLDPEVEEEKDLYNDILVSSPGNCGFRPLTHYSSGLYSRTRIRRRHRLQPDL
jgi:hypothetical protein